MKTDLINKIVLIFTTGIIGLTGAVSQVSAQKRGFSHQEQYQRQQMQNQQRFEQRQQNYQLFHQQRIEQPKQPAIQSPPRPSQSQPMPYKQRRINNGETKQIGQIQSNWDKSEKSWKGQYDSNWTHAQTNFEQSQRLLQQNKRLAQSNFQQAYWDRVREDRERLQRWEFYNDVVLNYSYLRNGHYFYISTYGVNMLRDAVNDGYQEGYLAGQADREDGYRYDFTDAFAYQDASYGYNGYWVDLGEYQYYFRQGFQKGYDDGYYNRFRFGSVVSGNYIIGDKIMRGIINFTFIG